MIDPPQAGARLTRNAGIEAFGQGLLVCEDGLGQTSKRNDTDYPSVLDDGQMAKMAFDHQGHAVPNRLIGPPERDVACHDVGDKGRLRLASPKNDPARIVAL